MEKNIGHIDRSVRLVLGLCAIFAGLYIAYYFGRVTGAIVVMAGLFIVYEALAGWCILYKMLGKNTCPIGER
jgi:hypothetical protein